MEITAAVLPATKQKFELNTISLDTALRPEEVLVKVVATGLCHTDLAVRDAQLPFEIPAILGHEGSRHCRTGGQQRNQSETRRSRDTGTSQLR